MSHDRRLARILARGGVGIHTRLHVTCSLGRVTLLTLSPHSAISHYPLTFISLDSLASLSYYALFKVFRYVCFLRYSGSSLHCDTRPRAESPALRVRALPESAVAPAAPPRARSLRIWTQLVTTSSFLREKHAIHSSHHRSPLFNHAQRCFHRFRLRINTQLGLFTAVHASVARRSRGVATFEER